MSGVDAMSGIDAANAFEAAAEAQMFEAQELFRNYERAKRLQLRALREGQWGAEVKALEQLLDTITLEGGPALITYIAKCAWVQAADANVRREVLGLIATHIARLRVRSGLPPFNDSLPHSDEPPTVYETVRHELTGVGTWA